MAPSERPERLLAAGPGGKVRIVSDDAFLRYCMPGGVERCGDFEGAAKSRERRN